MTFAAFAAICALVFLFQNCTNSGNVLSGNSRFLVSGGGNGDGYTGIVFASSTKCGDGTSQVKIKLYNNGTGLLIKDNCVALATPTFIPSGEIQIDQPQVGQITRRGLVFDKEPTGVNSISIQQYTNSNYANVTAASAISSSPLASPSLNGHLVVCSIHYQSPSIDHQMLSMTDNLGNNYKRAIGKTTSAVAVSYPAFVLEVWYAENILGGNGLQVTANLSGVMTGSHLINCYEYDGIVTENALDRAQSGYGTTNVDFGTFSTNWNNELVHVVHHGSGIVPSSLSGFQIPRPFPDSAGFMFINSVSTLSINFLHTASSPSVGAILTFKAKDRP